MPIDRQPMAGIDEAGGESGAIVDIEDERVGCRRNSHPHVRCGVEIIIGDVDVLIEDLELLTVIWRPADEQPRLILLVYAIEVSRRLGDPGRRLEIIEGRNGQVTGEGTVDVGEVVGVERVGEESARQSVEVVEIDRLITRATGHAAYPWWRVDGEFFGPSFAVVF